MSDRTDGIQIVAIGGSVRPGNYTNKALALVVDELRRQPDVTVRLFDPAELDLAPPGTGAGGSTKTFQEAVSVATGVILATPEYHGSYSSVIKLVIENLGFPSVLKGKPVALLGVAAGRIGAVKALEHLRGVCSHVGALVMPSVVSIAGVQQQFSDDGACREPETEKLVRQLGHTLLEYIHHHVCPGIVLEELSRGVPA